MMIMVDIDDTICEGDTYETMTPITKNIEKINQVIYGRSRNYILDS